MDQALAEAQTAVQLAPNSLQTQARLGFLLMKFGRQDEAHQRLQRALAIAETVQPELQSSWTLAAVRSALGKLSCLTVQVAAADTPATCLCFDRRALPQVRQTGVPG